MLAAAGTVTAAFCHRRRVAAPASLSSLVILGGALTVLCTGRPAYVPLLALPLLLPGHSMRRRFSVVLVSLCAVLIWSALMASCVIINASAFRGVDPERQLHRLMSAPGAWLSIIYATFRGRQGMEGLSYFKELVGVLGWLDVVLPGWFYRAAALSLATSIAATCLRTECPVAARAQGLAFISAFSSVVLIFVLLFLTWTPIGFPFVDGVQGRYFLPIALVLPLFLPSLGRRTTQIWRVPLLSALPLFAVISSSVTVINIVRRYYLQ